MKAFICQLFTVVVFPDLLMALSQRQTVVLGVSVAMVIGALPLLNKKVRQRENEVANMRDDVIDRKDAARNSRLTLKDD